MIVYIYIYIFGLFGILCSFSFSPPQKNCFKKYIKPTKSVNETKEWTLERKKKSSICLQQNFFVFDLSNQKTRGPQVRSKKKINEEASNSRSVCTYFLTEFSRSNKTMMMEGGDRRTLKNTRTNSIFFRVASNVLRGCASAQP